MLPECRLIHFRVQEHTHTASTAATLRQCSTVQPLYCTTERLSEASQGCEGFNTLRVVPDTNRCPAAASMARCAAHSVAFQQPAGDCSRCSHSSGGTGLQRQWTLADFGNRIAVHSLQGLLNRQSRHLDPPAKSFKNSTLACSPAGPSWEEDPAEPPVPPAG